MQKAILNLMKISESYSEQIENTVGKGEIARYEQFLLLPQCFQKACFPEPWADPEGGTGGPDPPWNFGKNVLIGFVKWYWFNIAQHLCKIQS